MLRLLNKEASFTATWTYFVVAFTKKRWQYQPGQVMTPRRSQVREHTSRVHSPTFRCTSVSTPSWFSHFSVVRQTCLFPPLKIQAPPRSECCSADLLAIPLVGASSPTKLETRLRQNEIALTCLSTLWPRKSVFLTKYNVDEYEQWFSFCSQKFCAAPR